VRVCWLYSAADERAHVLDENSDAGSGRVVTICLQVLSDTTPVYQTVPSMNICPRCGSYAAVPPPEHATRPESMSGETSAGTKKHHHEHGTSQGCRYGQAYQE